MPCFSYIHIIIHSSAYPSLSPFFNFSSPLFSNLISTIHYLIRYILALHSHSTRISDTFCLHGSKPGISLCNIESIENYAHITYAQCLFICYYSIDMDDLIFWFLLQQFTPASWPPWFACHIDSLQFSQVSPRSIFSYLVLSDPKIPPIF